MTQMKGGKDADGNDISETSAAPSTSDAAIKDSVDNACEDD